MTEEQKESIEGVSSNGSARSLPNSPVHSTTSSGELLIQSVVNGVPNTANGIISNVIPSTPPTLSSRSSVVRDRERKMSTKKKVSKKMKEEMRTTKDELRSLEKQRDELLKRVMDFDETLELNVGGIFYTTTRSTMMNEKDTLLFHLFSGRYHLLKDDEGRYFIDRDGFIFRYILYYLRSGNVGNLSRRELIDLRPEAEFFRMTSLLRIIDEKLNELTRSKFAVLRYNENSNVHHLSWQGKTEPCKLTTVKNLYKCIDEVLAEVDIRGWELVEMCGDGGGEGGWMYVFRRKQNPAETRLRELPSKLPTPYLDEKFKKPSIPLEFPSDDSGEEHRRRHEKTKST